MSRQPKPRLPGCIWAGCEAMDGVKGAGPAELPGDGSLDFEFAHLLGDDATLKAARL